MRNISLVFISLLLINILRPINLTESCEEKQQVEFRCRPCDKLIFQSLRDAPCRNCDSLKKYWELYSMDENGFKIRRITNNLYWEHQPDISPNGDKIVFAIHYNPVRSTEETDPGWEIAIMDIDGTNLTRLTNNDKLDACPHWNHDGTKIVYVSDTSGNLSCLDIYTMDSNGENITRLTNADIGEFYADPSFSFSNEESKILYIYSEGYTDNWDIYMMNEDGSNKQLVLSTNSRYLAYHDPMFSPDDNMIVFSAKLNEDGNHGIPVYKIFTMEINGSNITQVTDNDDESDVLPQYSPDGDKIAYFTWSWDGIGFERKIRIINIDGTRERILSTFSPEEMPSWYPRDTRKTNVYEEKKIEKTRFHTNEKLKYRKISSIWSWKEGNIFPVDISKLKNMEYTFFADSSKLLIISWNSERKTNQIKNICIKMNIY